MSNIIKAMLDREIERTRIRKEVCDKQGHDLFARTISLDAGDGPVAHQAEECKRCKLLIFKDA